MVTKQKRKEGTLKIPITDEVVITSDKTWFKTSFGQITSAIIFLSTIIWFAYDIRATVRGNMDLNAKLLSKIVCQNAWQLYHRDAKQTYGGECDRSTD